MTALRFDPALLPDADASPRCAEHAATIVLDPGGSALFVDEVLLIDVALPWPKPVWAAEGVTHVPEAVMAAGESGRRVRALAAVPLDDGVSRVVGYVREAGRGPMVRREWHVEPDEVGALADRLLREGLHTEDEHLVDGGDLRREVAICTQGSHDVCCGTAGARLVTDLLDARPDVSVRRVSHTGGHRYAPTGLTFPDGRMWGFVSVDELVAIVDRAGPPSAIAPRCRGWIGAPPVAQIAERAVLSASEDWSIDDVERVVSIAERGNGWVCDVQVGARSWEVVVESGRIVPTIRCRAEGGLPAKTGREYRVVSIRER